MKTNTSVNQTRTNNVDSFSINTAYIPIRAFVVAHCRPTVVVRWIALRWLSRYTFHFVTKQLPAVADGPRDARRQLKCYRLLHNFATVNANRSRGVGSSLKVGEQPAYEQFTRHFLCYDRRTCSKQYARQVTAEPGASTVASVINIARPSTSFVDNTLRRSTCRGEICWVQSSGQSSTGNTLISETP